jgi:hypothetical protein
MDAATRAAWSMCQAREETAETNGMAVSYALAAAPLRPRQMIRRFQRVCAGACQPCSVR